MGSRQLRNGETGSPEPRRRIGFDARRALIVAAAREVFAEQGYAGASMEEIARRAGITKATLYDHFSSKQALHLWLLDRQREELNRIGREQMSGAGTLEERVARTFDAFFRYVNEQPYAWRMLFRETTGDATVAAEHRRIHAEAAVVIANLLFNNAESPFVDDDRHLELASAVGELIRGGLHAITVWWMEHPDVPRETIVALCMNVYWMGLAQLCAGPSWRGSGQT
jgi:AcrR family transcriptional regulator